MTKSKSQAIRDYVSSVSLSKRNPSSVVAALKESGIEVSNQLVSSVIFRMKKKRKNVKTKTTNKKNLVKKNKSKKITGMETWIIAKNLLNSVGGDLTVAKKNLELVSRLMS